MTLEKSFHFSVSLFPHIQWGRDGACLQNWFQREIENHMRSDCVTISSGQSLQEVGQLKAREVPTSQQCAACAHWSSAVSHPVGCGQGHHLHHGNIYSCSLQGRGGDVVRRAQPEGRLLGRTTSFMRSGNNSSEQRSEVPLDHKLCKAAPA